MSVLQVKSVVLCANHIFLKVCRGDGGGSTVWKTVICVLDQDPSKAQLEVSVPISIKYFFRCIIIIYLLSFCNQLWRFYD